MKMDQNLTKKISAGPRTGGTGGAGNCICLIFSFWLRVWSGTESKLCTLFVYAISIKQYRSNTQTWPPPITNVNQHFSSISGLSWFIVLIRHEIFQPEKVWIVIVFTFNIFLFLFLFNQLLCLYYWWLPLPPILWSGPTLPLGQAMSNMIYSVIILYLHSHTITIMSDWTNTFHSGVRVNISVQLYVITKKMKPNVIITNIERLCTEV